MSTHALVVGAGPAGAAAAIRLARACDTVTIVEARPRDRLRRTGEHLPPAAISEFARLGFSDLLAEGNHEPGPGVRSLWGSGLAVDKDYFLSLPSSGVNLRRPQFDEALARRAERAAGGVRFGTRLTSLRRDWQGYVATVLGPDGERTIEADLVVDASGRHAIAARQLGAKRIRFDQLVGIVGRIEGSPPDEETGRVHVESAELGWWYGVRFTDGVMLASLMTDAAIVQRHPGGAHGLWGEQLSASRLLAPLARGGCWSERVDVFDASSQTLEHDAPRGFVAVGDAAAAYDPLSSWGIAKGLRDGTDGAEALLREREGDDNAVARHRNAQRRDFETHRARQSNFYGAETRWPASPFWRSRQPARTQRTA